MSSSQDLDETHNNPEEFGANGVEPKRIEYIY